MGGCPVSPCGRAWQTVSYQAVNSLFSWARSATDEPSPISTRNSCRTRPKNLSIFPRPWGRPGALWVILMPSLAAARFSAASTKALPLSTFCARLCYVAEVMEMALIAGAMAGSVPGQFT